MSSEEPVSAFSVFKAAKNMAGGNKNTKKNQNAGKNNAKGKVQKKKGFKKSFTAAFHKDTTSGSGALKATTKKKKNKPKNSRTKETKETISHKEANVVELIGSEVIADKKLGKTDQKKKKNLEEYLIRELERVNDMLGEDDDSFDSEYSLNEEEEEEFLYTDADTSSNEYISDGSSEIDKQSSSTNDEDTETAETLAHFINSKINMKRKSPEPNNFIDLKKPKRSKAIPLPILKEHQEGHQLNEKPSSWKTPKEITKKANVKLEPLLPPKDAHKVNSIEEGKRALKWLLNPVSVEDFFSQYWEQRAFLIKRQQDNYFKHLISFEAIDQMLLQNHVEFTKNIDVTSYRNGVRETLNPEGRALPPVVWDQYGDGCSIRLLNPQTFLSGIYTLCTTMQEYFHCLVGANAYLTPPNSQGFAPHYDDIEAFVLQIEGRKRWKLYKPRSTAEILPRCSSRNFEQQEIGKPLFEQVLEPGDVMYFPRGTIHQACTEPGYHSLHITLSVYQKQSFADLFEKMLPLMLQKAIASNVDLRRGLPLNAWHNAGIAFCNDTTEERANLTEKVNQLMQKCLLEMPLENIMDSAMDQLAKKFQHEALPPKILPAEKLRTVFGSQSRTNECGECVADYDIDERTNIRLLRANILRLVKEEEKIRIYYYLDNSKEYCEYEPNFIEIEKFEAASIEVLIKSYPQYVGVSELPLPLKEHKISLATALWERGLLMLEKPFK